MTLKRTYVKVESGDKKNNPIFLLTNHGAPGGNQMKFLNTTKVIYSPICRHHKDMFYEKN